MSIYIQNQITSKINKEISISLQGIENATRKIVSGLRVTQAADSVVDLNMGIRMKAQSNSINQALKNTQEGVSFSQTGDSALNEMQNLLQNIRTLVVQSLSNTISNEDKSILKKDLQEQIKSIDLLVNQTKFNQKKLFDGTFKNQQFQVGTSIEDSIFISLKGLSSTQLARQVLQVSTTGVDTTYSLIKDNTEYLQINGIDIRNSDESDDPYSYTEKAGSAIAKAKAINDAFHLTGVKAIVLSTRTDNQDDLNGLFATQILGNTNAVQAVDLDESTYLSINGEKISNISIEDHDATGTLVDAINLKYAQTGVQAEINDQGELTLVAQDGRNITLSYTDASGGFDLESKIGLLSNLGFAYGGRIVLQSDKTVDFNIASGVNQGLGNIVNRFDFDPSQTVRFLTSTSKSLNHLDLDTEEGQVSALNTVDLAIKHVDQQRGFLGALQNRLDSTLNHLEQYRSALTRAISNHLDSDFSTEITNYTENQIRFQSSIQIASIAGQNNQNALQLISNLSLSAMNYKVQSGSSLGVSRSIGLFDNQYSRLTPSVTLASSTKK